MTRISALRVERDRKLDRHAARDFLKLIGADTAPDMLVPVRRFRRLQQSAGHGERAASGDPDVVQFADQILPRAYGYPMKIRVPTKLGFKNPEYVISMEVTNDYKGGYWEDQGYNRSAAVESRRG